MNSTLDANSATIRFLQVEPTTRCNFTCGFCCGRQMDQRNLAIDGFEAALAAAPDLEHVELQGEGEPLLHPALFEMIAAARARGARVSLITNGSLFTPRRVAALLDAGVHALLVSIESPDPDTFTALRGGRLDVVTDGIKRLLEERTRRGLTRPTVGLAITVLAQTLPALPGLVALYDALGLDGGATVQALNSMDAYAAIYSDALRAELLSPAQRHALAAQLAQPELRRLQAAAARAGHFFPTLYDAPPPLGCPWLERGLYVDRHGRAAPCCFVKNTEQHGLGDLATTPPETILARRRAMAALLARGETPAPCHRCPVAASITPQARALRRARLRALGAGGEDATLVRRFDGSRTVEEVLGEIAQEQHQAPEDLLSALLPRVAALVASGALARR